MNHSAPNGPPPAYLRPLGYEDSKSMAVQNSTAAAGLEQFRRRGTDIERARLHVPFFMVTDKIKSPYSMYTTSHAIFTRKHSAFQKAIQLML